ncbi:MAG: GntR family transcriptional regulator [Bacillota bacterium]
MIKQDAPSPLFQQLKEAIAADITSRKYGLDQAIPSERELCRLHGVSRTTVRQALDQLVAAGLLYRVHGRGTFVAQPRVNQGLFRITSFESSIRELGLVPRTIVLRAEWVPFDLGPGGVLQLVPDQGLYCLELLGLATEQPMALYRSYFEPALGEVVAGRARLLAGRGLAFSTYQLYAREVGSRVTARQTFEAGLAGREVASVLQIHAGAPIFNVTSVIFGPGGRPVEFRRAHYRGDKYRFHVDREHVLETVPEF